MGAVEQIEHAVKGRVFDCRMCGQCVLHATGLTCPMTCPKTLRNGPCGGVRADGSCEVVPGMRCVWVQAYDHSLEGTSSWKNLVTGRDRRTPAGWHADA
jgi:hypothetical protein